MENYQNHKKRHKVIKKFMKKFNIEDNPTQYKVINIQMFTHEKKKIIKKHLKNTIEFSEIIEVENNYAEFNTLLGPYCEIDEYYDYLMDEVFYGWEYTSCKITQIA